MAKRVALHLRAIFKHQVRGLSLEITQYLKATNVWINDVQQAFKLSRISDCQFSVKFIYFVSLNQLTQLTHLRAEQSRRCSPVAPSQPQ